MLHWVDDTLLFLLQSSREDMASYRNPSYCYSFSRCSYSSCRHGHGAGCSCRNDVDRYEIKKSPLFMVIRFIKLVAFLFTREQIFIGLGTRLGLDTLYFVLKASCRMPVSNRKRAETYLLFYPDLS